MKSAGYTGENSRDLLSSLAEDDAVRPLLLSLRSLSHEAAPALSPELAAMLDGNPSTKVARARRSHRRTVVFSLALIGALCAGAGTAAAVSPELRSGAAHAIDSLLKATPFGPHPVAHPTPSEPPTPERTPGTPAKGGSVSHPGPSQNGQTPSRGNGKPPTDQVTPGSTNHPTPPAKGQGNGAP